MAITYSNNELRIFKEYQALTADTTLTPADSGKTFLLDAVGEVISLPAVADSEGVQYKFVVTAVTATTDWTVVAASNVIQGYAHVAGAHIPASNENTVSFVATLTLPGDAISLESDGTNWYVSGASATAASVTFTAV